MTDDTHQDAPFTTAADDLGMAPRDQPAPIPGLSHTPGLRIIENSPVPGTDRSHVFGPQQAACDPVLAGLDTGHVPATRAENRAITRLDGVTVAAPPDSLSDAIPGPSSTSSAPADGIHTITDPVTPTAPAPALIETPRPE